MLEDWRARLPAHLQIPLELPPELQIPLDDDPTDEGLPTDRALCMLHMKWNQVSRFSLSVHNTVSPRNLDEDVLTFSCSY